MRSTIISFIFFTMMASMIYSCQSASEIEYTSYLNNGKDIYEARCQNCHGKNGEGLGLLAPPLTDSVFLKQNKSKLACIIKNGASGPMVVSGKTYDGKMPAFPQLADIDIAQVIVYITNSFGNKQGMYSYGSVSEDLKNCESGWR